MDRIEAFFVIADVVRRHGDARAQAALAALLEPPVASPPTPVGVATNEARNFAELFHKTGLAGEWKTPPAGSVAMERLVHRLTCLLEAFLELMPGGGATAAEYCPICGTLLDDLGRCAICPLLPDDEHGGSHE